MNFNQTFELKFLPNIMCSFFLQMMFYQNEMLSVPTIKWLGVHPTDIISLNLPSISLTNIDQERMNSLLKRPYINSNNKILHQVLC